MRSFRIGLMNAMSMSAIESPRSFFGFWVFFGYCGCYSGSHFGSHFVLCVGFEP